MNKQITIGSRTIGEKQPCFIIAELSANHNHSLARAKELIRVASECGVDAIKLQTYTPDTMTIDCDNEYFQVKHPVWGGQTLYQLYAKAYTPWEWHAELKNYAESLGLVLFSTPFDNTSVDFLETLDMPCYKIASFELVDIPLIKYIAAKQKPIIMSTGMGTIEEIDLAVQTIRDEGNNQLILLKCTSSYPANVEDMNLSAIQSIQFKYSVTVGLSDHSMSNDVCIAAVALGAKVIEKHFTLSRIDEGPDSHFSLEPEELKNLVKSIRAIEASIGNGEIGPTGDELKSIIFRRSLFVVKDIKAGEVFTKENLRSIRPGNGLAPKYYYDILGKKASQTIPKGTPLTDSIVEAS